MQERRTAHLIYGPVAAGKSTYGRRLAGEERAVRFAIDEWMHALFADDRTARMDMAWAMTRVARCQTVIWSTSERILDAGTNVVLEIGLMREQERERMKGLVEAAGHRASFHFVDADRETRLRRVSRRNAEKGDTYSFEVTPTMFEAIESFFERPSDRERGHQVVMTGLAHG